MTASVGGAAPNTADPLLHSVRSRVTSHREGGKKNSDEEPSFREVEKESAKAKAAANSRATSRAEKSESRKPSESESVDSEASFVETIDSIGQQEPKANAVGDSHDNWLQSVFDAAAAGANPVQQQASEVVPEPMVDAQRAMRPVSLLRQDSIAALMDAKARLMQSSDGPNSADVSMPDATLPHEVLDPIALSKANEPTPATVNAQETHWNFNDRTLAAAALQASRLQPEERPARAPAVQQNTADPSNDIVQPGQVKPVAVPAAEASGDAFSAGQDESGPRLQQPATADSARGRVAQSDSADSSDQIWSIEPKASQNPGNVASQVRNGVIDALAGKTGSLAPSTMAADLQDRPAAAPPVLRSLDLTLSPPDLGSIHLRMTLKSNALEIEADVSKAATAKILNDDRSSLERGLRDAGYDVTSLKISDTSANNSTTANSQQNGGQATRDGSDQARSNFAGNQDSNSQRREGAMSDESQHRRQDQPQQTSASDPVSGRAGSAVYI